MNFLKRLSHRTGKFSDFLVPVIGWLPVLAFLFYSIKIRIHDKYLASILIASGRTDLKLSLQDVLFLYRQDLIFFGVLLPLLLALAWKYLRRSIALTLSIVLVVVSCTILYANLQSWGQVGRFLTASALVDAATFAMSKPDVIGSYISVRGLVKYFAVLALGVAYFVCLDRLAARRRLSRWIGALGLAGWLACLAGGLIGYSSTLRANNISASFLVNAVASLMPASARENPYAGVSDAKLVGEFNRLAKQDGAAPTAANFGAEKKSNLLLFVLETGSIEFLDTRKPLPEHRVWDLLPKSRYISQNHFSTFPASAEANLSILTGMYPPRAYYDTCLAQLPAGQQIPTLVGQLDGLGVHTAVYAPFESQVPMDKVVFERTGFKKVFYGALHRRSAAEGADEVALQELLGDIKKWGDAKQQFAVGFYPQLGHGPWDEKLGKSVAERGHKVALQQLDWLAAIVDQLARSGVLQDTVILITGDHGVRTTEEDPSLKVGMIDRYALQVPLILVAPHSRYPEGISDRPTSHVDVPAELSQLFGLRQLAQIQGLPFLDKGVETRRQFFMADWYYGADGYREPGESAMYSSVLGVAFARPDGVLSFAPKNILAARDKEESVRRLESDILDVQFEWVRRFGCAVHR